MNPATIAPVGPGSRLNGEAGSRYVYRCEDHSILLGSYRRFILPLWAWWVPRWLPANFITLGSSACMWVVLGLSLHAGAYATGPLVLMFLVLTQAFLAYDHVDGMQAKATGTSSALGEFLDHSLDIYHGAILTISLCALLGTVPPWLVLAAIASGLVPFAATMVEEKETGRLVFGWFGSFEALFVFNGFYVSCLFPAVRTWWSAPLVAGMPAYGLLLAAGAIGCVGTTVDCLRRIKRLPTALATYIAASLVLTRVLANMAAPLEWRIAALLLYGGDYIGRVIGSHLLQRPQAWPDFVGPVLAGAALFGPAWLVVLLVGWLMLRTAWGVFRVIGPLRRDWRWTNPPPTPA